jgi:hypothetical protein
MPLLPTQSVNTNAVDLGQGPSIARAGQTWEAVSKVGATLTNFAEQIGQKRKEAELKNFIDVSEKDFERDITNKQTELAAKYTGDPTGYASEINEYMNNWYAERQEMAPRDSVKEVFQQRFNSYTNDVGIKAEAWENEKRAKYQMGQIDLSVKKDAGHLVQNPDPNSAAKFMTKTAEMVNNGVGLFYDQTEAQKLMNKYGAETSTSMFDGMKANKQYKAGLAILEGKHPSSKMLLQYMDPKDIASYKASFQNLQQAENDFSKSMFNLEAKDVSKALQDGVAVSPEKVQSLLARANGLKPEEKAVFMDDLQTDLQYNRALQEMKVAPISEMKKMAGLSIPRDGKDVFNYSSRSEKDAAFRKKASELIDKRQNSPAEYYAMTDKSMALLSEQAKDPSNLPALNEYTKQVVGRKMADGTEGASSILTPDMSKTYGTLLKSDNPQMAEEAFKALSNGMTVKGTNYAQNAIFDMVKNGDLEPAHAMALSLDSKSRESALANLRSKKTIENEYETVRSGLTLKDNANDVLEDPTLNQVKNALIAHSRGNEGLSVSHGLTELVTLEYKAGVAKGLSTKAAKAAALDKVVHKNLGVAKFGNSQLLLVGPDNIKQKDKIETFMRQSLIPKTLKDEFKIAVPKSYPEQLGLVGKEDEAATRYYTDLYKNGEWVLNEAQNGVTLYKRQSKGLAKVRDTEGKPVTVLFDSMGK